MVFIKEGQLLSRQEFRELCLKRDNNSCVICQEKKNVSVHHIIERRLFKEDFELGGYVLNNGASLCQACHLKAEMTILSCDEIRLAACIKAKVIPSHLYEEANYCKWGNEILSNGLRVPGELFQEEPVQKILGQANLLGLFTNHIKYPRTYHLPWSDGRSSDDKVLPNCSQFENKEVVVTVKLDGENSTLYSDYLHARSVEYNPHPSRSWLKQFHAGIANDIPVGWRLCGENLFAKHSIHYHNLKSYFYLFSIWNQDNCCLSWDETVEWANLLNLKVVPVLYRGPWNENLIKSLYQSEIDGDQCEGYVVRIAEGFHYRQFRSCAGKFVRAQHVTTNQHWLSQEVVPNKLNGE